jgi:hypothetical protein
MRLDYGNALRWQRQFDAHFDERVKTQFAIGIHERSAQTEVLHAAADPGQGGSRHLDRYIHADPLSPTVFHSIAERCHCLVRILGVAAEPCDSGTQIHQAPAQVCGCTNQLTKWIAGRMGGVNHCPGNAPEQPVTRFRGQVL